MCFNSNEKRKNENEKDCLFYLKMIFSVDWSRSNIIENKYSIFNIQIIQSSQYSHSNGEVLMMVCLYD